MTNDQLQIGVVGLGGWGKNVVRSFAGAPRCKLEYVCDANPDLLRKQGSLYPQATPTNDFQTMLQDTALDAVAIVTPAPTHYSLAKAALEAGKHVYVEKPMTLRADHAEELVELAEKNDRKLMVGHLLEYHPVIEQMKRSIDAGELGDVYYMYCQRLNLGVVRSQENAFWSLAPHDISVILHLFGAEPIGIEASGGCFLQDDVEDVVFVNLHFADGRVANIHVSWLDPHKERKMVVVGSKKMLVFDDMQASEKLRIYDKGANLTRGGSATAAMQAISVRHGEICIPSISGGEPLDIETRHFVDAVLNDTTPRSDGYDGLRVVRILEQVEQRLNKGLDIRTTNFQTPLRRVA